MVSIVADQNEAKHILSSLEDSPPQQTERGHCRECGGPCYRSYTRCNACRTGKALLWLDFLDYARWLARMLQPEPDLQHEPLSAYATVEGRTWAVVLPYRDYVRERLRVIPGTEPKAAALR